MATHYLGTAAEVRALNSYIKLSRAAEAVSATINTHLRDHDLTLSQFGVLEALYHLGPMQTGQLGEKILKSSGNMTLVIDNLVKRDLVRRARREDDRRCVDIHLTADGSALLEGIWQGHLAGVVSAFGMFSPAEHELFSSLCRKLGLGQAELA